MKIALKYKVKQSKNSKFPPNYKANPIDFETQISNISPSAKISPSKRAFEKYKPRGLLSEFNGMISEFKFRTNPGLDLKPSFANNPAVRLRCFSADLHSYCCWNKRRAL